MEFRTVFSVHLTAAVLCLVTIRLVLGSCPDVTRSEWGARPPRERTNLTLPVGHVVIHHTFKPGACADSARCMMAMRRMQDMHQIEHGWSDIGYNFCVGGDGLVYEGRGWDIVGAHAPKYNFLSIGICFIGDFRESTPSPAMLAASKTLIECGIARGSISPEYKLLGHSQVRETECPGGALLSEIRTWPHWSPLTDIQPRLKANTTTTSTTQTESSTSTTPTGVEVEVTTSLDALDVTSEVTQNNTIDGASSTD